MKLKLATLTAVFIAIMALPKGSLATDFWVRLGQPKSPTSQNNFKLTFVASDLSENPTRNITVKCFKKGPSDSDFSQFDGNKELIIGGNTDFCDVTSSILNTNGSYSFKVVASVSAPSYQELPSAIVSVDFNTSGPSTPNSYSKEKINSCDYKIKFRTADDGKTTKVQLFRSDTLNISVGASSVLTQQNIGPNTAGEFINSVPTCGKDYYYVLRAVDSSDNVSGTIGDSFTTTTSTTTTVTTGAGNGGQTGTTGALALSGASTQVNSPATDSGSNNSETTTLNSLSSTPSVLGSSTEDKKGLSRVAQGLIAIIIAIFVFRFLRKSK